MHPHAKLGIYIGIFAFLANTFITHYVGFTLGAIATCAIGYVAIKHEFIHQPIFRTLMFTHVSFSICFSLFLINTLPETITRAQQHGLYVAAFGAILIGLFKLNKV